MPERTRDNGKFSQTIAWPNICATIFDSWDTNSQSDMQKEQAGAMSRRRVSWVLLVVLLVSHFGSAPSVLAQSEPSAEQVNVEIIVDSSGSMAGETDTGAVRMDAAKQVLRQVVEALPESGDVNVGMRIYGHEGDNTDAGRDVSCASSDLVVPVDGVDKTALLDQVESLVPVGWTPLGASLAQAGEDFQSTDPDAANAIILLTDGIETCDGDPAGEAESLANSDQAIVTHVIGFATIPEDQAALQAIADSGNGELYGAANTAQLMEALFQVLEDLEVVEEGGDGTSRYSPIGRGRVGAVGDYEVTVIDYTPEATDVVLNENQFNEPPAEGYQFAIAQVSVTYTGDASGEPGFDLDFQSVGDSAVGYTTYDPGCGVYPDDQYSAGELFTDGTVEYNVCWQISSLDEDSLVMYVDHPTDFDAEPVWFSLGNPAPIDPNAVPADEEGDATPVSGVKDEPEVGSKEDAVTESSRDEPVPIGIAGALRDFHVTVLDVTPNATDDVMSENQFNEPPQDGYQFYIARVRVTSISDEAIDPAFDLDFQSVGDSAVGYTTYDPGCGVYPEDQYSAGELFPGGTVEFNVCWQIASEDENSLVMYVEQSTDFDSDPVWFSLQPN